MVIYNFDELNLETKTVPELKEIITSLIAYQKDNAIMSSITDLGKELDTCRRKEELVKTSIRILEPSIEQIHDASMCLLEFLHGRDTSEIIDGNES